jgi:hypothetical protein
MRKNGALYYEPPHCYKAQPDHPPAVFLAGGITNCPRWHDTAVEAIQNATDNVVIFNPNRAHFPIHHGCGLGTSGVGTTSPSPATHTDAVLVPGERSAVDHAAGRDVRVGSSPRRAPPPRGRYRARLPARGRRADAVPAQRSGRASARHAGGHRERCLALVGVSHYTFRIVIVSIRSTAILTCGQPAAHRSSAADA